MSLVGRRVIGIALTLLVTSFVVYGAIYIAPGTPLAFLRQGHSLSPQLLATLNAQYHLNDPFFVAYWHWLSDVLRGNLGTSIISNQSVWSLIRPRIGATAFLVAYAGILIVLVGVGGGVLSALRPRRFGPVFMLSTSVALAVPAFVSSVILIVVFGVDLGWFPILGAGQGFIGHIKYLTLPAVALALGMVAYVGRVTRSAVSDELSREHVETGRARGLPKGRILRRHVLRNSLIPIVTVGGIAIAGLIAYDAVVETAFGINGIGAYLIQSVEQKDFPVVQALVLLIVLTFVVLNTVVDTLYALLDPRIAARAKR